MRSRFTGAGFVFAFILLALSCASRPASLARSAPQAPREDEALADSWAEPAEKEKSAREERAPAPAAAGKSLAAKPAAGSIRVRELARPARKKWTMDAYSASLAALSLDEALELRGRLGEDRLIELCKRLFRDLPAQETEGDLRLVELGGYFPDGSPLLIRVSRVPLASARVLRCLSNSALAAAKDPVSGRELPASTGDYMDDRLDRVLRFALPGKGRAVAEKDLSLNGEEIASATEDMARASAIGRLLRDQDDANDSLAAALYDSVMKGGSPAAKALATFNWGLSFLKAGKPDRAEALWKTLPPSPDPAFLLKLYRSWHS